MALPKDEQTRLNARVSEISAEITYEEGRRDDYDPATGEKVNNERYRERLAAEKARLLELLA